MASVELLAATYGCAVEEWLRKFWLWPVGALALPLLALCMLKSRGKEKGVGFVLLRLNESLDRVSLETTNKGVTHTQILKNLSRDRTTILHSHRRYRHRLLLVAWQKSGWRNFLPAPENMSAKVSLPSPLG